MAMASAPVPSLVRVSFSSQANRQTHSSKQGLLGEDLVISLLTVLLTGSKIAKGPGMLLIYLFLTLNLTSVHRAKLLYDSHHQCVVNQVCLCGWGFFERHPSQAQLMLSLSMETVTEEQPTSLPTYLPACLQTKTRIEFIPWASVGREYVYTKKNQKAVFKLNQLQDIMQTGYRSI